RTSTWRSFATISSGLCFFWGIPTSSYGSIAYFREDHFSGGRPKVPAVKTAATRTPTKSLSLGGKKPTPGVKLGNH
ncbi:hypothetical protein LGM14_24475, partial [Burkholderia multivorans]|nr:hypothetical protein [Burkholderia multivorans]